MSSRMMCVTRWGGCLGARPGWNVMSPCGPTLRGGTGAESGVVSGVCNLVGGVTCEGDALSKISASCRSAAVCLSPDVLSGIVGVGLRRAWVRSTAACVAESLEDIIGKVSVARKNPWCLRLFILSSWRCRALSSGNISLMA